MRWKNCHQVKIESNLIENKLIASRYGVPCSVPSHHGVIRYDEVKILYNRENAFKYIKSLAEKINEIVKLIIVE